MIFRRNNINSTFYYWTGPSKQSDQSFSMRGKCLLFRIAVIISNLRAATDISPLRAIYINMLKQSPCQYRGRDPLKMAAIFGNSIVSVRGTTVKMLELSTH